MNLTENFADSPQLKQISTNYRLILRKCSSNNALSTHCKQSCQPRQLATEHTLISLGEYSHAIHCWKAQIATIKTRPTTSNMVAHRQNGVRLTEVYQAAKNIPSTSQYTYTYTQRPCYDTESFLFLQNRYSLIHTLKKRSNYELAKDEGNKIYLSESSVDSSGNDYER